jgi:hypothetical protein
MMMMMIGDYWLEVVVKMSFLYNLTHEYPPPPPTHTPHTHTHTNNTMLRRR